MRKRTEKSAFLLIRFIYSIIILPVEKITIKNAGAMKYFIVDDNAEMRKMIKTIIEKVNDTSMEFENGKRVVEEYGIYRPDWVLMDIEMKGINGLDTAKKLKEKFPEVRVVIVTQYDDKIFRKRADELQVAGYILKDNLQKLKEFITNS